MADSALPVAGAGRAPAAPQDAQPLHTAMQPATPADLSLGKAPVPAPVQTTQQHAPAADLQAVAAAAPVLAQPVPQTAHPAPASAAPAAAPAPAAPAEAPFVLPVDTMEQVAQSSGLQWVHTDAAKVAAVQAAIAAEPAPVRVPRERPPVVAADDGPLVLVETRRNLADLQLPFDAQQPPSA